jgi:hypothetical protein
MDARSLAAVRRRLSYNSTPIPPTPPWVGVRYNARVGVPLDQIPPTPALDEHAAAAGDTRNSERCSRRGAPFRALAVLGTSRDRQAERLLVTRSFAKAAEDAAAVLAAELHSAAADNEESLCDAAAAVLLQARHLGGAPPALTLDALVRTFGTLHGVPPESLALWCAERPLGSRPGSVLTAAQGAPCAAERRRGAGAADIDGGAGVRCDGALPSRRLPR